MTIPSPQIVGEGLHPVFGVTSPSSQTEKAPTPYLDNSPHLRQSEKAHPVFGVTISSPQTVGEGLHPVFGDAVWGGSRGDPSQHAGGVHHAPFGKAHERQEGTRHVDHSEQVD